MTRTERNYYLLSSLFQLFSWFLAPVYPLFLLSRGLDVFEASGVLAVFLATTFLFEVPTGAVADVFGRKISFLASCAIRAVAFALYSRAEGFLDCATAEVIDGIGITLASGSLDAWAVDGMRAEGDRRPTDRFFARAQMLARGSMIAAGLACGYLAEHGYALPWLVGSAGFVVTGVLAALLMDEPPRFEAVTTRRPTITETIRDGVATLQRSNELRFICAASAMLVFAVVPAHMYWQPRIEAITGPSPTLMGWIWAAVCLSSVVGSALLPRLLPVLGRHGVLAFGCVWRSATFAVSAAATSFPFAAGGWLLQEIGYGLTEPVFQSWTSDQATPEQRATVLSLRSMFVTLGGSIGLLLLGLVARAHGIPIAWGCSAALLALLGAWIWRHSRHFPEAPRVRVPVEVPVPIAKVGD